MQYVTKYIGDRANEVTTAIAGKDFKSVDAAKTWIEADIKERLANINMNVTIPEFNITCKINGVETIVKVDPATVQNYKDSTATKSDKDTPETSYTTESTPESPTQESDMLSVTSAVTFKDDTKTLCIFGSTETGKAGNNFTITDSNYIEYRIQYSGEVVNLEAKENATLKSLVTGATSQGTLSEGRVFGYKDKLYIYKGGAIYGIEARPLDIHSYQQLYDTIFKGGSDAEKARRKAMVDNMNKNAASPGMF
jgi:hypothetical protein